MNNESADKASSVKLGAVLKVCAGLVVVLVFLTLAGVVAASFLVPRRYYSKVTMELRPNSGPGRDFDPNKPGWTYDPQYTQTQFAILQKAEILYPVIGRLGLDREYAPAGKTIPVQDAYRRLRASMKLQEVRSTGLVEIGVFDTDAQRAANIANTIALVYREATAGEAPESIAETRRDHEKVIGDQREKAEEASRVAMEIRARNGIADPDPEKEYTSLSIPGSAATPNDATATGTDAAIAAKAKMTEYVEAKQRAIRARKVLESIENTFAAADRPPAHPARLPAKIWEKAERAEQPENRIATLLESVLR